MTFAEYDKLVKHIRPQMVPTTRLRWRRRRKAVFSNSLQQWWEAPFKEGSMIGEWRDVDTI